VDSQLIERMSKPARRVRLTAVATHPIQYHAPLFRALAENAELDFEVAFLEILDAERQGRGFGVPFQWDIPVLDGYRWRVLRTTRYAGGPWGRALANAPSCVERLGPDVLLLTGWQTLPLIQLLSAARRMGVATLMRGESNALRPRNPLVHRLHRWMFERVDGFLVIGRANRALYEGHGIAAERLFDAPYFVDNDRFAGEAFRWRESRDELRATLGIPPGAACFLFVGKFERKKHPEHVVAALGALRRRRPDLKAHALFVGAGALAAEVRALASREGISATFAGFMNQTEMPKAYVAADALVLASDYGETWGLVVNEAMACGLPAVVSDRVGCGPDLIEAGVTGSSYPFGNVDAMVEVLQQWVDKPDQTRRMGRAAAERVRCRYTVGQSVAGVIEAVTAVMQRNERGRRAR
jgi:glycosyltransferase involved in cell wall biosynthesis